LNRFFYDLGVVLLGLIGLYALVLAFVAATPAMFVGAGLAFVLTGAAIIALRRRRPATD
jgi:membrane-bound ClpP family serine protease